MPAKGGAPRQPLGKGPAHFVLGMLVPVFAKAVDSLVPLLALPVHLLEQPLHPLALPTEPVPLVLVRSPGELLVDLLSHQLRALHRVVELLPGREVPRLGDPLRPPSFLRHVFHVPASYNPYCRHVHARSP